MLTFVNHANMGDYMQQINEWLADALHAEARNHRSSTADHHQIWLRRQFRAALERLAGHVSAAGDGTKGSTNPTRTRKWIRRCVDWIWEVTVSAGDEAADRAGLAFVSNGISRTTRISGFGGLGFLLGDGRLNYGRENIVESYYTLHFWTRGLSLFRPAILWNPGYNRDRGPVICAELYDCTWSSRRAMAGRSWPERLALALRPARPVCFSQYGKTACEFADAVGFVQEHRLWGMNSLPYAEGTSAGQTDNAPHFVG